MLVKKQSRLDVRKFSFSQRTINVWNKLSTECVHANSVNMFKNKIDKYLVFFCCRILHTMFSYLQAHAFARSVTVARSSAVQASSSRRQERRWAIVCGSPQSQSTDWASSR